ncbi:MAG: hemolysin family protein [Clostridiales bacterium]|nr:hemolysin family protein [Clostridiales bacterium]
MDPSVATKLIVLLILLALSSFFSSAETALTTVNKLRIRTMVEEGVKRASVVSKLIEDPGKMLSAILIGNNVVNLSASSLATSLAIEQLGNKAAGIATGILTLLILIFGEITPKTLATIHAEKLALVYAPIINLLTQVLTPVIFIVNKLSLILLLALRVDPKKKTATMTENELRTIVDVSHEEGVIESEERKMITNVVDFGDSLAKDIMVPRIDMAYATIDMTYSELLEVFREEKYSRLPVYSEEKLDIIGIINLKDVFFFRDDESKFHIKDYMREPYYTYEFKKTSELLGEMRKDSISMAIVLDEYGATAGLITIEDLLEEIVGEIRDEYDEDEEDIITQIGDHEYIADGSAKLDEINEYMNLRLESEDYDSIAGHIIHLLDHLPEEGEQIKENNVTFTVSKVDKNRIDKVHILIDPEPKDY